MWLTRGLLASGVPAGDIALAASPGEYDDLILAISQEASLDVHFAYGRRALTTREGQAAAVSTAGLFWLSRNLRAVCERSWTISY